MGKSFAKPTIGRRIIALATAYVIALSSLVVSLSAGYAAAAELADGSVPICHAGAAAQPSPLGSPDRGAGKLCTACCVGCLTQAAMQPSPPAEVAGTPPSPLRKLTNDAAGVLAVGRQTRAHQSRAPPPRA
ncbi:MAG: hypothetical protein WBF58_06980 [Xanthobacteraceae bacterium]